VFSSYQRNASALVIAEHEGGKLTPGTLSTINAASQLKGDVRNNSFLLLFLMFDIHFSLCLVR
jgi:hypothetical protein